MARISNGFVGSFATNDDLTTRFPPSEYAGCSANIGLVAPIVKAISDGVTWNNITASASGIGGSRLALLGDSRMAQSQINVAVSSMSISTRAATIGGTGLGDTSGCGIGQDIIIGNVAGMPYMRATITSRTDANTVVATVQYPTGALTQGSLTVTGAYVVPARGFPTYTTSPVGYAIPMAQQPFAEIRGYAFPGAKLDHIILQARDAIAQGCDEVWVIGGFNDYNSAGANTAVAIVKEKYKQLWRILRGRRICHLYENPVISPANTAGNLSAITNLNAFISASASTYGLTPIDVFTPMVDPATGLARAGYINTGDGVGVHYMPAGAMAAATVVLPTLCPVYGDSKVNAVGAGTTWRPIANPTMSGTLGDSPPGGPSGYGQIKTGTVTIAPTTLRVKSDGSEGNELVVSAVGAVAGDSVRIECAAMTVVAAQKFRARAHIKVEGATGLSDIQLLLVNALTPFQTLETLYASGNNGSTSDMNGTYDLWLAQDVVIPAGITSVLLRLRPFWDAAGSAVFTFSDYDFEGIS